MFKIGQNWGKIENYLPQCSTYCISAPLLPKHLYSANIGTITLCQYYSNTSDVNQTVTVLWSNKTSSTIFSEMLKPRPELPTKKSMFWTWDFPLFRPLKSAI